jgi:hypothetical protein
MRTEDTVCDSRLRGAAHHVESTVADGDAEGRIAGSSPAFFAIVSATAGAVTIGCCSHDCASSVLRWSRLDAAHGRLTPD